MGDQGLLRALLDRCRARLRRRGTLEMGLLALAAGSGSFFLVALAAGLLGPSLILRTLGGAVLVAFAVAAARAIVVPILAWRRDERVARFLDEATGAGDLTWSALEIGRSLPSLEASGTSPELARALVKMAVDRGQKIDLRKLIDLSKARRRGAFVIGTAALWALGFALFPSVMSRGLALFGSSEVLAEATNEPILADLELHLRYPAYTGLPERDIPGTSGEILAPPGTVVTLKARALLPASSAELSIEDVLGQRVGHAPIAVAGGTLSMELTVDKPGAWRVTIVPPSGRPVREATAHRIEIEADRAPRVELAAPADDLEVAGPKKIELAYSADDDYGLGDLTLVWRAASDAVAAEKRKIVRPAAGGRSASGKLEWDLAELELKPGVRVAYRLEAKDNDDVGGPNIGSSRTLYVRIYSPTEKHDELLAGEQSLVDHAVGHLGDRIDAEKHAILPGDAARELEDWTGLHGRSEGFLVELGRVAGDLEKDSLAPKDLKPALVGIHDRLAKLARDEELLLKDKKKSALKSLRDGNPRQVAELERDVLLLDDLISRQRLEELLAIADEMAHARDRLKSLLEQYKKSRSEALRKEIEREIRELQRKMAELAEKAQKLQGEIPDEFLNKEAMGDNDLGKQLDSIQQMLERGDIDQAMAELQKMSQALDKMIAQTEQDLRGFRNERFSAEEKALSELENKLADLEHDERQLQTDTDEVKSAAKQRTQQLMKERVEPFLKRARNEAAEMKKRLQEADPNALQPYDQEQLERAKRRVDDLSHALEQGDLDEARSMAHETVDQLRGLGYELREEERRSWEGLRPGIKKARDHVDEAGGTAKKLSDEIDQIFPKAGELLTPGERSKLSELRERQAATRRRTEELRKEMEKRGKDSGGSSAEGMQRAGDHMMRAERSLDEGDPRDSVGEEGQAAEQLHQLRKDVQQQRRPKQEGPGSSSMKETVKIPGGDDFRGPEEFRRDLLDAMKRQAPKEYQEQVRRFYEELAR
jgi:hypothetical protein